MSKQLSHSFGVLATTALCAAWAGSADAASLTAEQILSQYNLVAAGNVSTTSDIDGSAAIGGSLKGTTFFSNARDLPASPSIYLFGALARGNLNIDNKGSLYSNDVVTSPPVNFNGGASYALPAGLSITNYTTPLNALETELGALTANSVYTSEPNRLTFHVTPGANDIAVFDISASALGGLLANTANPNIMFSGLTQTDPNLTIVVNVTGATTFDANADNVNFSGDTYLDEHIIWNFEGFTSLNFRSWHGAVLAGDATVTNGSPIEGFLYALNFYGGGLHNYAFDGTLPANPNRPFGAVPELSTWAMLVGGFAGLGVVGFRRRRASAATAI
jgi:choice-of-anchor A domain-containing protein